MSLEQAVLASLAYSDIFDYPLNFGQIHNNLIFKKVLKNELEKTVKRLSTEGKILKFGEFYQLKRQQNLAKKRYQHQKFAFQKLKRAKFAAKVLSLIPTVKLIGISGALAVLNTPKDDDIDLFIVCSRRNLWTTRFFCNLFSDFLGLRRKPGKKEVANKICLNMFVTEDSLKLTASDLYLAHEILQLKPLFEKDNTHSKFLKANSWAFKFLPNWPKPVNRKQLTVNRKQKFIFQFSVLEKILRNFQLKYMSKRRTTEKISDTRLFFHPHDVRQKVLIEFEKRLKELKIPLDPSTSSGSVP